MKEKRKISYKRVAAVVLVFLALLLIIGEAAGIFGIFGGRPMHFVEVAAIELATGANPSIHAHRDGFFLLERGGISSFDLNGNLVFSLSHNISNPALFGRGAFAAIAEAGGMVVNVYDAGGLIYSVAAPAPVLSLSLNCQGFLSLIMYSNGVYLIHVYNSAGAFYIGGPHLEQNVVPFAADVCRAGRVLAVSYVDVGDAEINSFVNFFFITRAEYLAHDYVDGLFAASLANPGQIIGKIRFMEDGRLVALSNTRIFALDPFGGAATVWEIAVNNRILYAEFGDNWFGVAYGDVLLGRTGYAPGTMAAYNSAGRALFSRNSSGADMLDIWGGSIVMGGNGQFTALDRVGDVLWELSLPGNVSEVRILGTTDRVVTLAPNEIRVLQRVRY